MRILMITDFYPPIMGGVEFHVQRLSVKLAEAGNEVAVVTQWQPGLPTFSLDQQVQVYRIRGTTQHLRQLFSAPERTWAPPSVDPQFCWGIRQVVAAFKPDIVHGHDWLARSFLPLKRWSGAKLVMSLHYYTVVCAKKTMLYQHRACSGPGAMKCLRCAQQHYGAWKGSAVVMQNGVWSAAEQALVDLFLPVSHATAAMNNLGKNHLPYQVIPNFLSDDVGESNLDLEPYLRQLPAEDFLLFVGVMTAYKGFNVLLQAYSELKNPPPLVVIAPKVPADAPPLPSGVLLLSAWPNEAVMAAWRRSLLALVPSVWAEPCATVVLEAMKEQKAVIASSNGGMPDMIVDQETGLLVPPDDAPALRVAIEQLLANPERRTAMGLAGAARVEQFRARAVVPRIEKLYAELQQDRA